MNEKIHENAKAIVWECNRIKRVEEAIKHTHSIKPQRLELYSQFSSLDTVYVRTEDIGKERMDAIQAFIIEQLKDSIK